ncbi:hypothetical protein C1N69_02020 [Enterobacter sichuanensis]|nr:hypothetical protein C1N69_02020 [Enterobacter sichuanensis]
MHLKYSCKQSYPQKLRFSGTGLKVSRVNSIFLIHCILRINFHFKMLSRSLDLFSSPDGACVFIFIHRL